MPETPEVEGEAAVERRTRWRVFATALLLYTLFLWPFEGEVPLRYLDLARALVEDRSLTIDPYAGNTSDKAERGGHAYLAAAPGPALVGAPAYAVGRVLGGSPFAGQVLMTWVVGPLAGAAAAAAFFALTGAAGPGPLPRSERLWLTTAFGGATFFFPLATVLYAHALTCAAALGALWAIERHARRGGARSAALAGALAACLPLCEYPAALVSLALAALVLVRSEPGARLRAGGWFVLGGLGPVLLLAGYHTLCFGAPWRTGYGFHANPAIQEVQALGVAGFTFPTLHTLYETTLGAARGLLVFAPPVALAIAAGARLGREDRVRQLLAYGLGLTFLLLHAARGGDWYGGFTWGPRYQALALPFWLLLLASPRRPTWAARALPAFVLVGLAVSLIGAGTRWPQTLGSGAAEALTFGVQAKGLTPLLGGGRGYAPAGVERLTALTVGLTTLGVLGVLGAGLALWRPSSRRTRRTAAVLAGLVVLLQFHAVTSSRGRETPLRQYLRDREFIAFAYHFEVPGNLVAAAEVALRLGDREEAARAARRALELDPDHEGARLRLALALDDRAALERLAATAEDAEVRRRAGAALGR